MSLVVDHPHVTIRDLNASLQAFRVVSGLSDANSDRGRVFVEIEGGGGSIIVFSDKFGGTGVAEKTGFIVSEGPRHDLDETDSSGLTMSVLGKNDIASEAIVVYLTLAGNQDLVDHDDRIGHLLLEADASIGQTAETDFYKVLFQTSGEFYRRMKERYPPPVRTADPLRYPGTASQVEAGRKGLADIASADLWLLNDEGDWELTGLQNPGDWRQWAVYETLARIWRRKGRSGEDAVITRSDQYQALAEIEFDRILPEVDVDRDSLPERQVKRKGRMFRRS